MTLLMHEPDPRIPVSLLMLCVVAGFREQARQDAARSAASGAGPIQNPEFERNLEEPERWDGMS